MEKKYVLITATITSNNTARPVGERFGYLVEINVPLYRTLLAESIILKAIEKGCQDALSEIYGWHRPPGQTHLSAQHNFWTIDEVPLLPEEKPVFENDLLRIWRSMKG
jgi:hypothetical protein